MQRPLIPRFCLFIYGVSLQTPWHTLGTKLGAVAKGLQIIIVHHTEHCEVFFLTSNGLLSGKDAASIQVQSFGGEAMCCISNFQGLAQQPLGTRRVTATRVGSLP